MSRHYLIVERQQKIIERVSLENAVDFASLSTDLRVSVMTVRRDIRDLERLGFLKLTRGGAYAQIIRSIDILLSPRAENQSEAKSIIGKHAASLIEPGEVIFIGPGSTTAQFVQFLNPELDLTLITPSIPHASFLAAKGFKVISTGGEIATDDIAQIGYIAHENIRKFYATKSIIGTSGISKEVGLSEINIDISHLNQLLVKRAEEVLVLADISKLGLKATYPICGLDEVTQIITTQDASEAYAIETEGLCEIVTAS
jgi:DeoR/GlpR family transcriptional regulator of sugar metabolism